MDRDRDSYAERKGQIEIEIDMLRERDRYI